MIACMWDGACLQSVDVPVADLGELVVPLRGFQESSLGIQNARIACLVLQLQLLVLQAAALSAVVRHGAATSVKPAAGVADCSCYNAFKAGRGWLSMSPYADHAECKYHVIPAYMDCGHSAVHHMLVGGWLGGQPCSWQLERTPS